MTDALSDVERRLLAELADDDGRSPAALALTLDADLPTVFDAVRTLQERDLLVRDGFDSCRLTGRGRDLATADSSPGS